tara:strand:+ start:185 stop:589 length:405 start_codon:yes stop_codon:yes gene_type:complete
MARAIDPNNFLTPATRTEFEGVDITLLEVAFGADVSAEIGDPRADSLVAGLKLVQDAIMDQGVNILGVSALGNSDQNIVYIVRSDSIDETNHLTGNSIRDAIRAVDTNGRAASATPRNTANISGATVTALTFYS